MVIDPDALAYHGFLTASPNSSIVTRRLEAVCGMLIPAPSATFGSFLRVNTVRGSFGGEKQQRHTPVVWPYDLRGKGGGRGRGYRSHQSKLLYDITLASIAWLLADRPWPALWQTPRSYRRRSVTDRHNGAGPATSRDHVLMPVRLLRSEIAHSNHSHVAFVKIEIPRCAQGVRSEVSLHFRRWIAFWRKTERRFL